MAPGSRGVGAVFVHSSDAKIPVKRGMLSANREFHDVAGVIIFPTHPGSRINLLRAGKTLRAKAALPMSDFDVLGTVGKLALPIFARFRIRGNPSLDFVRYGPASRVHRGVFGPFEGSFPIRIPADPDKFLAIREFHVVHGCVLFPMCPGSQINLLRVRKTLCASVATSVGKFPETFSKTLFCRPVFTRVVDVAPDVGFPTILVSSESLRYLLFNVLATTLSFLVRFRPVKYGIEALDILYTLVKGWSVRSSFWSGQRSGQTLVKLGQTWSKALQTPWKCIPELHFKGFWARRTLVGLGTARSNLGQTSVNPSQTWSTLVKLGQTLGNVSRTFFLGVFDADEPSSDQTGLVRAVSFCVPTPEKIPGVKMGL
uniref:Uncharacterized protein n=1 Tax=Fagus sylvatica TaxID=28930 RepID=A0A2N9HXT1_FAGSY